MKMLFDLFPVILFFVAYKMYDMYVATAVIIAATILQNAAFWLKNRRFEKMHIITLVVVLILGGLTLILKDPVFIKWKPTIVNVGFAIAFLGSQYIGHSPIVQRMLGQALELEPRTWMRLNLAWVAFFLFCAAANLVVAYTVAEETWVNFKLFGLTGLSFLFIIVQLLILRDHIKEPEVEEEAEGSGSED